MTTTPNRDELILTHRLWVGSALRLPTPAAQEFLSACSDDELQAIIALQGCAMRDKLAALKTIYGAVHERTRSNNAA